MRNDIRTIELYKLVYLIYCIFSLVFSIVFQNSLFVSWIAFITVFYSIYIIKKVTNRFICTGTMFLIFTYLFNFGQTTITVLGMNDLRQSISVMSKVENNEYVYALLYGVLCMFTITIGYFITYNTAVKNPETNLETNKELYKQIAKVMLAVSIIPLVWLDVTKISVSVSSGYTAVYDVYLVGYLKYFNLISKFGRASVIMLICCYQDKPKVGKAITYASVIYYCIMMLSGDRSTNVIYLLITVFMYHVLYNKQDKLKIKTVFTYCILVYLGMCILSTIGVYRSAGDLSYGTLKDAFDFRSRDGILYSFLREFGNSLITLVYTIRFVPQVTGYGFGLSYPLSLIGVLLKAPASLVNAVLPYTCYVYNFPDAQRVTLGGSAIGEMFFNFGWLGVIGCSVFGYISAKLDKVVLNYRQYSLKTLMLTAIFLPDYIWFIRDFAYGRLMIVFWTWLFIEFFSYKHSNQRR